MPPASKTTVILFNYGGGMRGLIPAYLMARIEEATGLRMAEMVDVFAGPSTGSILNAAMTRRHPDEPGKPLYKARHMIKFYEREGLRIFPPDSSREFRGILHDFNNRTLKLSSLNSLLRHGHYDPGQLSRSLDALLGETTLSDTLSSLVVPIYNIDSGSGLEAVREKGETGSSPAPTQNNVVDKGGHAVWFKNMMLGDKRFCNAPRLRLQDAILASCAAPTYFPCHHFSTDDPASGNMRHFTAIDGSIFDNPCISYLGAIRNHIPADHKVIMIVLGTGYTNRSIRKDEWNRFGPLGVVDPVNDLPLINIFFNASESALMDSFAEEMGDSLYVFNKSMLYNGAPSIDIDDASPDNLAALSRFAEEMVEENKAKLDNICDILVRNRDGREETMKERSASSLSLMRKYLGFLSLGDDGPVDENR
jgi:predicted acylesterase/phospholipase RssA